MLKTYELARPRKAALAAGLLFDVSRPAGIYGASLVPTAITRTLWRALAHEAAFDDGDERIMHLCSQANLAPFRQGPSATVDVPGLQVRFVGFSWRGGAWTIRVMYHLEETGEGVCTLCPAAGQDLQRCAEVLGRYHSREVTSRMYRVLGLPTPELEFAELPSRGPHRPPTRASPHCSLEHTPLGGYSPRADFGQAAFIS